MSAKCPDVFGAFDSILATEQDPRLRESLIARAGYFGVAPSESFLQKTFREGVGQVDRRAALAGLARLKSVEATSLLQDVIAGDFEEAVYDIAQGSPVHDALSDLRAHAVIGVLQHGGEAEVTQLVDRFLDERGRGGAIGSYVASFLSVLQSPRYVPRIVEIMVQERQVDPLLLAYIEARSDASHHDLIESLLELSTDEATIRRLTNVMGRLH
jgi:hypothetical protein